MVIPTTSMILDDQAAIQKLMCLWRSRPL